MPLTISAGFLNLPASRGSELGGHFLARKILKPWASWKGGMMTVSNGRWWGTA